MLKYEFETSILFSSQQSLCHLELVLELLVDLKTHFKRSDDTCIYLLWQQLSIICQGQVSIHTYFTRLKAIWDDLQSIPLPYNYKGCLCCGTYRMTSQNERNYLFYFFIGLMKKCIYLLADSSHGSPSPSLKNLCTCLSSW